MVQRYTFFFNSCIKKRKSYAPTFLVVSILFRIFALELLINTSRNFINMKHKLIILLSVFSILSCNAEDNNEIPTSMKDVTINNFPILDGSYSTSPLRYILMCKLLGFDYEWQASPFIQNPDEAPKRICVIANGFNRYTLIES